MRSDPEEELSSSGEGIAVCAREDVLLFLEEGVRVSEDTCVDEDRRKREESSATISTALREHRPGGANTR